MLWPSRAEAATPPAGYLLFCYFSGGWDQLLALDPRDATLPEFQQAKAYGAGGSGIYPAYGMINDAGVRALLANNPSGIQRPAGSPLTFGPAVPLSLMQHAQDLCLVRGVSMGTLTHEVGRRYFITGKFPRGLQAAGSSLPTVVAAQAGDVSQIPNLAVGVESYNENFPAFASGLEVQGASDVYGVLRPGGTAISAGTDTALRGYEAAGLSCAGQEADGSGLATLFRASREKARELVVSGAASHFNFTLNASQQTQEIKDLFAAFGIVTYADLNGPRGQAALAAQALTKGISQAVSVQLATGIDDHSDSWQRTHPGALRNGFDALANLISFLKNTPDAKGGSVWSRTTLMVFSEFARTPLLNPRGGRDHHLASSCLLAGPGIQGNKVVGGTNDNGMTVRAIDPQTGLPGGTMNVRPADLHATVLQSMGLPYTHLTNQSPQVIPAILKG
jgi:uncharacterized protein (DUF1501 family)